jgi:hypothetical protein
MTASLGTNSCLMVDQVARTAALCSIAKARCSLLLGS